MNHRLQSGRATLELAISIVESDPSVGRRPRRLRDTDRSSSPCLAERPRRRRPSEGRRRRRRRGGDGGRGHSGLPRPVLLKVEKIYDPCVLLAKKRYAGRALRRGGDEARRLASGVDPSSSRLRLPRRSGPRSPVSPALVRRKGNRDGPQGQLPSGFQDARGALRLLFDTRDLSLVKRYCRRQWLRILQGGLRSRTSCSARRSGGGGRRGRREQRGGGPAEAAGRATTRATTTATAETTAEPPPPVDLPRSRRRGGGGMTGRGRLRRRLRRSRLRRATVPPPAAVVAARRAAVDPRPRRGREPESRTSSSAAPPGPPSTLASRLPQTSSRRCTASALLLHPRARPGRRRRRSRLRTASCQTPAITSRRRRSRDRACPVPARRGPSLVGRVAAEPARLPPATRAR